MKGSKAASNFAQRDAINRATVKTPAGFDAAAKANLNLGAAQPGLHASYPCPAEEPAALDSIAFESGSAALTKLPK